MMPVHNVRSCHIVVECKQVPLKCLRLLDTFYRFIFMRWLLVFPHWYIVIPCSTASVHFRINFFFSHCCIPSPRAQEPNTQTYTTFKYSHFFYFCGFCRWQKKNKKKLSFASFAFFVLELFFLLFFAFANECRFTPNF